MLDFSLERSLLGSEQESKSTFSSNFACNSHKVPLSNDFERFKYVRQRSDYVRFVSRKFHVSHVMTASNWVSMGFQYM